MAVTEVNKPPVNLSTNYNPCSHPLQIRRVLYGRVYAECVVCSHMTPDNRAMAALRYRPIAGVVYTLAALLLLFLVPSAHAGGANYTMTPSFGVTDSTPYCKASGTINCWTMLPGIVQQVSIGADGAVYGQNSAHTIYKLLPSTTTAAATWVQSSLPAVMQVAVQDGSNIYALSQQGSCAAPTWGVYKANASLNGWVSVSPLGCANSIAVSTDGVLGVVAPWNGGVAYYLKPGGSWNLLPGTGYTGKMAVQNAHVAYALKGTSVFKANLDNNTVVQIAGLYAANISVDPVGTLWFVGSATGVTSESGNVLSWDGAHATPYRGFLDQVATGPDMDYTFGIQNATGNIYHFRHSFPYATVTITGNYDCSNFLNGCPTGSNHTAQSTVAFQSGGLHGSAGVVGNDTGTPASQLHSVATESGTSCDLVFGDPNSPACQFSAGSGAKVFCSIMGALWETVIPKAEWKIAITKSKWTGGSASLPGYATQCAVFDWCKPGGGPFGNPPLASYSYVEQRPFSAFGPQAQCFHYYIEKSLCVRYKLIGGTWQVWKCVPEPLSTGLGNGAYGSEDPSVGQCTGPQSYYNALP